MSHHTVDISADFPSREAAHAVKARLTRAGFARNSIDIDHDGEGYRVTISTRQENQPRAERILNGSPLVDNLRHGGAAAWDTFTENRTLALGLAALAGFALYGLTSRRSH